MATASHRSHRPQDPQQRWIRVVRWSARGLAAAGLLFLLSMLVGHLFEPEPAVAEAAITFGEAMGFVWMGLLLVGYVVGWWRPLLGGAIAVGSMAAFYVWFSVLRGSFLAMGFLAILALPGALYLVEAELTRRRVRRSAA